MPPAPARFLHSGLDSRLFDEPNLSQTFRTRFFDDGPSDDPFTFPSRTSLPIAREKVASVFSVGLTICFWPRVVPLLTARPELLYISHTRV